MLTPSSAPPPSSGNGTPLRPEWTQSVVFQGLLVLGGLAAFLLLLLAYGEDPNPLLIAVAGAILVWPLRGYRAVRALLLAGGFLLTLWLLRTLGAVLTPFVIVFILAYLLNPAVTWAEVRWKAPRWASTLVLTLVLVGLIVLFVLLIVPSLVGQIQILAAQVIDLVSGLPRWVAETDALDLLDESGLIERSELTRQLATFLPSQIDEIAAQIPAAMAGLSRSVGTLFGLLTMIALVPVLLFYVLKDYLTIRDAMVQLFPRYRGSRRYLYNTSKVVGNYLRGQLTISALGAVLVTIPLLLFNVPFALVIGLLAGLLNMIPNLGAIMTYIIGGLLMLAFGTLGDFVIVMIVLVGQAFLEQSVLTPNIMGQSVGLHPVLIILSLFVFSAFLGFLGLLIAVPATALLVGLYQAYRDAFVIEFEGETELVVKE